MFEALRYFAGSGSPRFAYSGGKDVELGLPQPSWIDPYGTEEDGPRNPYCAKPNIIIISDINPNYDSASLPGSYFGGGGSESLGASSLNVSAEGQTLWNKEFGGPKTIFIGHSNTDNDNTPSPKTVTSFGNIRGLTPEEPSKMGGYHTASVAYYGHKTDMSAVQDDQKVTTYAVALSASAPKIRINVNGKIITLLPFAKSVGRTDNSTISEPYSAYQPTNSLVDFHVDFITPTSGQFRVNFEDREQGADYDMDSIVLYDYSVDSSDNSVTITVTAESAAGGTIQHLGYVISGTTADGTYIVDRDKDTKAGFDVDYEFDTPPGTEPEDGHETNDNLDLPQTSFRKFTPSSAASGEFLESPLWYAAKYGGYSDRNNDGEIQISEWDSNHDGIPDNYFLITNPSTLIQQLSIALGRIIADSTPAVAATLDNSSFNELTRLFKVEFDPANWSGHLLAFALNDNGTPKVDGTAKDGALWDAADAIDAQGSSGRNIMTYKPSTKQGIAFQWPANPLSPSANELDTSQISLLNIDPVTGNSDSLGEARLDYLRGSQSNESVGHHFRQRSSLLGDIINSTPRYVKNQAFHNPNFFSNLSPETNYQAFLHEHRDRQGVIYSGANDGMLHAFSGENGSELMAFVPNGVYDNLSLLTSTLYTHHYYVDGSITVSDAFFSERWHTVLVAGLNKGGRSVYALDITDPSHFGEADAENVVLWEFSHSDLGLSYSQPSVVRLANGKWAAVFGNGYNNTGTRTAVLFVVDLQTGALIRKIDTDRGPAQDPSGNNRTNGLATPALISANFNGIATTAYAGDLYGNLWKFDLSAPNSELWDVSYTNGEDKEPIFQALNQNNKPQPITTRPTVGRLSNKHGFVQIYFGTGQYLTPGDQANSEIQSFYAIEDKPEDNESFGLLRSNLLQQQITAEYTLGSSVVRTSSRHTKSPSYHGWYLDLIVDGNPLGERVISQPLLRNGNIIFTTLIPTEAICASSGTGWLMELFAENGGRQQLPPFDLNNDGLFNNQDNVNEGETTVSGLQSTVGIISTPGILSLPNGAETKYLPGSQGGIQIINENVPNAVTGRQSWQQLR